MWKDRSWLTVGFLGLAAGFGIAWMLGASRVGEVRAQAGPVPAESGGTMAFTSGTGPVQFLYIVDTKNQALAVYRVDTQNPKGVLKLEAARQYRWDMKLAEYNNSPPEVTAIESMVAGPR
jgi:hypothetical protein